MKIKLKTLCYALLPFVISSCGFFDKDNTPQPSALSTFTSEINPHLLWNTRTGFGTSEQYVKLVPAIGENAIFTANVDGTVVATDKISGKMIWKTPIHKSISAGPEAGDGLVFVGSRDGIVTALRQNDGTVLWNSRVSTEILASPAVGNKTVIVKSIDGKITALSEDNGHLLWNYQESEPTLILRGSSKPQIYRDSVIIGFANGSLVRLSLKNGNLLWKETIAIPEGLFAVQRMIDIDADPVVAGGRVYAATYQGKVAALDLATGKIIWTNDVSSYSGIATNGGQVFVSDARSNVTAFDADSGVSAWQQNKLYARNISGPAIMGNYVIVGDSLGYLHWLNRQDGRFVARNKVGGGILAAPVVKDNILFVTTRDGRLAAYQL